MKLNSVARDARKKAQLARIAAKEDPSVSAEAYSEMYASQPAQQRIRAEQTAARQAERARKDAASIQAKSDAEGATAAFGGVVQIQTKTAGKTAAEGAE